MWLFMLVCLCVRLSFVRGHFEVIKNYELGSCKALPIAHSIRSNIKQSMCTPKNAIVQLRSSKNELFIPNSVMVRRCGECGCYGRNSCMPTETAMKRVAVQVTQLYGNTHNRCAWVDVPEHTACECQCRLQPGACDGPNQRYDAGACKCMCTNNRDKYGCTDPGWRWDENKCACVCRKDWVECSTGSEWVPRMCRCMKMMTPEDETKLLNLV